MNWVIWNNYFMIWMMTKSTLFHFISVLMLKWYQYLRYFLLNKNRTWSNFNYKVLSFQKGFRLSLISYGRNLKNWTFVQNFDTKGFCNFSEQSLSNINKSHTPLLESLNILHCPVSGQLLFDLNHNVGWENLK